MKTLIVSATQQEINPLLQNFKINVTEKSGTLIESDGFDFLICGVGQLACAFHLSRVLQQTKYKNVLNLGIAGSFSQTIPAKTLVNVSDESLADLGAESPDSILDIFDMNLIEANEFPFSEKKLIPIRNSTYDAALTDIKKVHAVTVNRVLSNSDSIAWVIKKYSPQVVSMEGAAVFFACLQNQIPCTQLRAISDLVGARDKSSWDIRGAIDVLNQVVIERIIKL